MKKLWFSLVLLIFAILEVFPVSALDIATADSLTLSSMASLRGLDTSLGDNELRSALYEYEGLSAYQGMLEEEGQEQYRITILNTDHLTAGEDVVILEGNVSLSFLHGGEEKKLESDYVVLDAINKSITLTGNVDFPMEEEGSIHSDVVTFYWERGDLFVERATTISERETGEDKKKITVYSVGEKLTFLENGTILYEDGYIASSEKDPLSSISASSILMLPGSDMMIENATLKIGRVPIFYFPIFFYPGSRITGNPAFGFSSSRGAFLNTTFELFGRSELIKDQDSSSFLQIFEAGEEDGEYLPTGAYYSSREESWLDKWARESSSSLSLMADAYSEFGVHAGLSAKLNFLEKTLTISMLNGIGYTSISSSDIPDNFRYYGENSIDYKNYGLNLSFRIPYYSDRYAYSELMSRNTHFSIDPLFGFDTKINENTSTRTTFSRSLELSYTLPTKYRTSYLDSLNIRSLDMDASYKWDYDKDRYILERINLPSFDMTISGGYDTSYNLSEAEGEVDKEKEKDPALDDAAEKFILSDPLLYPIYKQKEGRSSTDSDILRFALGYNFTEKISNYYGFEDERKVKEYFSSSSSLKTSLDFSAFNYFKLSYVLTPNYKHVDEKNLSNDDLWNDTGTDDFTLSSSLKMEIPVIGLSYKLDNRLYSLTVKEDGGSVERKETSGDFSKDSVSEHYIALSKTFSSPIGSFTPRISYTLYPLTGSLTPSFSYSYGYFSLASSWKFQENADKVALESDLVNISTSWNSPHVVSSLSFEYQSRDYDSSDFFKPLDLKASLALRTEDRKYAITQSLEYESSKDGQEDVRDYFSSIRTSLTLPYFKAYVDFSGEKERIELNRINVTSDISSLSFQLWKGRLYFSFGLKSAIDIDVSNIYASSFSIEPSVTFAIAEFLDFRFSLKSVNNNFGAYMDDDGEFSFAYLWKDLVRSFDFFGEGRRNTQFNLSSLSLEIVHYMEDWDLHCKYSSEIVLSDARYEFVPRLTIFLSWNTFPDLKVDQDWKKENGTWVNKVK